ncbi:MAG: metal transporter [Flavobacteriales bacterium]
MKFSKELVIIVAFTATCISGFSQNSVVKDTITVEGICGMCKTRIEDAAFGKGVKFAEWTNASSELVIVYRSDKTSLEEIEDRIAKAGHSTEHKKAEKADYESLPDCCRYEDLEKH